MTPTVATMSSPRRSGERPGPTARRTFADASRHLLRSTVLESVNQLAADRSWNSITMAQIAAASGLSRQTLYNEFGNRDDLATAYVLWASEQFLDEIEREVSGHRGDLRAALAAAFQLFLELAVEHPLVRALEATTGAEGLHALVATSAGAPVITAATDRLVTISAAAFPEVDDVESRRACEVIVRLAISHLTVPTDTARAAATNVDHVVGPFLSSLAGRPG